MREHVPEGLFLEFLVVCSAGPREYLESPYQLFLEQGLR